MVREWDILVCRAELIGLVCKTGETAQALLLDTHIRSTLAFSPDDQHIISGSDDGTIRGWNAET